MATHYGKFPPTEAFDTEPLPRPSPQVIETMLDDLEDKVRHYFKLYTREKKARGKAERYNYWLQTELAQQKEVLIDKEEYIDSLEKKFHDLRGDPVELKETIQRIDLMYLHLDTLIQALAGVCGYIAVKEATKEQLLQCALEYLYPCRSLDPRLYELYGALYYFRLGDRKRAPPTVAAPPSPVPEFLPPGEIWSPWLRPGAFTPFKPAPAVSPLEKGIEETAAALAKAEAAAAAAEGAEPAAAKGKEPAVAAAIKKVGKPAEAAKLAAAVPVLGKKAETVTERKPAAAAPLAAQKRAEGDAKVPPEGVELLVKNIKDFKRPAASKVQSLRVACRLEGESAAEMKRKEGRYVTVEKMEGSAGNESAALNLRVSFTSIPPRKGGLPQKFLIDVYDDKGFSALGKAEKLFTDPETLKEDAAWDVKDTAGKVIGTLICSVYPLPRNAALPAQGGVLPETKATAKEGKPTAAAAAWKAKEEKLAGKPGVGLAKKEVKKPAEAPKEKAELAKPPGGIFKKPELPPAKKESAPTATAEKKEGVAEAKKAPPPSEVKKVEIKKPEIKKPELKKPALEIKKPELPGLAKKGLPTAAAPVKPPLEKPSLDTLKKPVTPGPPPAAGAPETKEAAGAPTKPPGLEIKKPGLAVSAPPKKPALPPKAAPSPEKEVPTKPSAPAEAKAKVPEAAETGKTVPKKAGEEEGKIEQKKPGVLAVKKPAAAAKPAAAKPFKPDLKAAASPPKLQLPGKGETALPAKPGTPAAAGAAAKPTAAVKPGLKAPDALAKPPAAAAAAKPEMAKGVAGVPTPKLEKKILPKKYPAVPLAGPKGKGPPTPIKPGALAKMEGKGAGGPAPVKPPIPKPAAAAAKDKAAVAAAGKGKTVTATPAAVAKGKAAAAPAVAKGEAAAPTAAAKGKAGAPTAAAKGKAATPTAAAKGKAATPTAAAAEKAKAAKPPSAKEKAATPARPKAALKEAGAPGTAQKTTGATPRRVGFNI